MKNNKAGIFLLYFLRGYFLERRIFVSIIMLTHKY